jgi:hypothetical protein
MRNKQMTTVSGTRMYCRSRMGLSRKAHLVVIARRNDEAIRLFSVTFGLLHFVRNDESGLLRQPLYIAFQYLNNLNNKCLWI